MEERIRHSSGGSRTRPKAGRRSRAPALVAAVLACALGATAQIRIGAVTSGASFEAGLPAKGSIATLFCTGLTGITGIIGAQTLPLPRELAGVRMSVGGAAAPLFALAVSEGFQQVNFQVPLEAEFGPQDAEVAIEQQGQRAAVRVPLRLSSPGDFFRFPDGRGIFQHAKDYSLVTPEAPARPGEALIAYLTGLPGTVPAVPSGHPAPFEPLAIVPQYSFTAASEAFRIRIDSSELVPLFVGLAPGLVGVYQVNFVLPEPQPAGDREVVFVRRSCRVIFGSCLGGGGTGFSNTYFSTAVRLPVR